MHGVWRLQFSVDSWSCYVGATCENGPCVQIIEMIGKLAAGSEGCRLSTGKSTSSLPVEIRLWPGVPQSLPDPEKFRPRGLAEFYSVPNTYFGTLGFSPHHPDFPRPDGLEIGAQLPQPVFGDIWDWLRTPHSRIETAYADAFGDKLATTESFERSWAWDVREHSGRLFLAKFGMRFAPTAGGAAI